MERPTYGAHRTIQPSQEDQHTVHAVQGNVLLLFCIWSILYCFLFATAARPCCPLAEENCKFYARIFYP
jgi:hypothetical protein